ncbi:uncharacterized protein LOC143878952 [Tasmannia lanceolata]|uniref:uncharacterized protein LOC143878952 n=1 Tax=Tasmannia lanceolata TaxID=3420 RepID=UPI004062B386
MNLLNLQDSDLPRNISTASLLGYKFCPKDNIQKFCSWKAPLSDELKLNSDASLDEDGDGTGGVLRNWKGDTIAMYSYLTSKEEIFEFEIPAVKQGIEVAVAHNFRKLWIESDSSFAVKIIQGIAHTPWNQATRVQEIKKLLSHFDTWKITHIWREANTADDILSKRKFPLKGCRFTTRQIPASLTTQLDHDRNGMVYQRL